MPSRRALFGFVFATVIGAAISTEAAAQGRQDFTLVNRTGYQIDEVYVSLPTAKTWGNDILGENVLRNGASLPVRFASGAQGCSWELKVKFDDGSEVEWNEPFNLCQISRITLRYNRSTGVTSADSE